MASRPAAIWPAGRPAGREIAGRVARAVCDPSELGHREQSKEPKEPTPYGFADNCSIADKANFHKSRSLTTSLTIMSGGRWGFGGSAANEDTARFL